MAATGINWNRAPNEGNSDSLNNVIGALIDRIAALEGRTTTPAAGSITNAMLAGSITNAKLASGGNPIDSGVVTLDGDSGEATVLTSHIKATGSQVTSVVQLQDITDAGSAHLTPYINGATDSTSFVIHGTNSAKVSWAILKE